MNTSVLSLSNQSKLLVTPFSYSQSITIIALVRSGPRFDFPAKDGISHFVEHMLFRGTVKFPNSSLLASVLEKRGASVQAFSYYETNKYWVKMSTVDFELGVENLLERLQNSLFSFRDIEVEKGVVREELAILKNNPESFIWDLWSQIIWAGNDLGRVYIGNKITVNSFKRSDVIDFFSRYYEGNRIIYSVCGNIKPTNAKLAFNKFIRPASSKKYSLITSPILSVKSRRNPGKGCIYKLDTDNITVAIGFLTVSHQSQDRFSLQLIASILGGGLSSRLRKKVMQAGLTYSIEAYSEHLSDTGYFMIKFSTAKKHLNRVLNIVCGEIRNMKERLIDRDELETAKGYFTGSLRVGMETSYDFADWYGTKFFLEGKIVNPEEECMSMNKVTDEDILEAANKYFDFKKLKMALIGDISQKDIILEL